MRLLYIITYDIRNDKRLRYVFHLMKGYGDHLQYSVFRCDLTDKEKIDLISRLSNILKHDEDQILFIPLGPAGGEHEQKIYSIGRTYVPLDHNPIVI